MTNSAVLQKNYSANRANTKLRRIFAALADPGRLYIFKTIYKKSGLCVTEIAEICGMSVPAASQQLRILEMSNLVQKERCGRLRCFFVKNTNNAVVKKIIQIVNL